MIMIRNYHDRDQVNCVKGLYTQGPAKEQARASVAASELSIRRTASHCGYSAREPAGPHRTQESRTRSVLADRVLASRGAPADRAARPTISPPTNEGRQAQKALLKCPPGALPITSRESTISESAGLTRMLKTASRGARRRRGTPTRGATASCTAAVRGAPAGRGARSSILP